MAKPTEKTQNRDLLEAKEALRKATEQAAFFEAKCSKLDARFRGLLSIFRTQNERCRPIDEPIEAKVDDLVVGTDDRGRAVAGRILWKRNGGGIWHGQELIKIEGHPFPLASNHFYLV